MLKQEIRILSKKMAARLDSLHSDGSMVFLSYWNRPTEVDQHHLLHGNPDLIEQSFREMEPAIRRLEGLNLNPSESSTRELCRITRELGEFEDPEMGKLFARALDLLEAPLGGQAILMVSWTELSLYTRRYTLFGGMVSEVVSLFNGAADCFRRLSCEETHDE